MPQVKQDIQDKVEKLQIVTMETDHQRTTVETATMTFSVMNRIIAFSQNGVPIYAETRRLCNFYRVKSENNTSVFLK